MDVITTLLFFCLCIMNFLILIITSVGLVFLLRLSYFIVKMFDYIKELGEEEGEEWTPSVESTSGLVDLPSVINYADENVE